MDSKTITHFFEYLQTKYPYVYTGDKVSLEPKGRIENVAAIALPQWKQTYTHHVLKVYLKKCKADNALTLVFEEYYPQVEIKSQVLAEIHEGNEDMTIFERLKGIESKQLIANFLQIYKSFTVLYH